MLRCYSAVVATVALAACAMGFAAAALAEPHGWHGFWARLRAGWLDSGALREARDIRLIVDYYLPI